MFVLLILLLIVLAHIDPAPTQRDVDVATPSDPPACHLFGERCALPRHAMTPIAGVPYRKGDFLQVFKQGLSSLRQQHLEERRGFSGSKAGLSTTLLRGKALL